MTRYSLSLWVVGIAASASAQTPFQRTAPPLPNQVPTSQHVGGLHNVGSWDRPVANTMPRSTMQLRPVPREGTQAVSPAKQHDPQHQGWNLKWRRSENAPAIPTADVRASTRLTTDAVADGRSASESRITSQSEVQLASAQSTSAQSTSPHAGVAQAAWMTHPQQGSGALELPQNLRTQQPPATPKPTDGGFFDDPFGDELPAPKPAAEMTLPAPTQTQPVDPARPIERRGINELRSGSGQRGGQEATPGLDTNSPAQENASAEEGPSFRDRMREGPSAGENERSDGTIEMLPPPRSSSDEDDQFDNPFDRIRDRDADEQDLDRLNVKDDGVASYDSRGDDQLKQPAGLTCEDFRTRIAQQTINQVSLDISPPFRPDVIDEDEYQKLKNKFDDRQTSRTWRSIDGRELATGRLTDLAYEKALIKTEYGATEELIISRLSEGDLAYISENWGLPKECLLEQGTFEKRAWIATTMTWKASNLCHKPLYFQEVNLERYGHTAGPVLQPVVSSAHFFANIAVLPYKMGVHSPDECQYALGYYRPGNCAPWIIPPAPISLRGGLSQAAFMTGAFWLVP